MNKQYVIVEHRSNAALDALRKHLRQVDSDYDALLRRFKQLEQKYGEEVMFNSELIDILRENKIPYRSALDHKSRS